MLCPQHFHNNFTTNFMWQGIFDGEKSDISSGLSLKPITTCYLEFVLKMLWV